VDLVLGINSAYHESAAAAVRAGEVLAAVEEERFSRRKHGKAALVDNADELPWRSIEHVLARAGARPADVAAVAYGFAPRARRANVGADPAPLGDPAGFGSERGEAAFEAALARIPARLLARGIAAPLRFVPHHRAHAASAFYPSPFERAAVLVLDGIGEHATSWLGRGAGARLAPIERARYPHSLGLLWERVSVHLGFGEYGAPKVMGLAAWGDPARFRAALGRVLRVEEEDGRGPPFRVDLALARFRAADTSALEPIFGPPRRADEPPEAARFADLAAALQRATEDAVLAAARRLARLTGERRLCYAGGVALNCVANARLEREGPFEAIYVPPAAHDAGTAVGAALEVSLRGPRGARRERRPGAGALAATPFLGPEASEEEARAAAREAGLAAERVEDAPAVAARALAEGAIVGWVAGALELGPRALGHRSLLADPRRASVKDELNRRVKHREPFRPFGASILAEACEAWLDLPAAAAAPARELMLFAYPVRPERRALVPAVVHRDGTCRVQAVERARDPRFHRLIARFAEETGVPLVLNTSFNDSEPIVLSPADALRTFAASRLDVLFLGDLRVVRRPA
jgi:carbamoyltransferase